MFLDGGDEFVAAGVQQFAGELVRGDLFERRDLHQRGPLQFGGALVEADLGGDSDEPSVEVRVDVAADHADPGPGRGQVGRGWLHALGGQQPAHHPPEPGRHAQLLLQRHRLPGHDADVNEEAARDRVVGVARGQTGGGQ